MGIPVSNIVWRECCSVDSVVCSCGLLDRVSRSVGRVEESILDLILVIKSSSSLLLLLEELLLQNEVLGVLMELE